MPTNSVLVPREVLERAKTLLERIAITDMVGKCGFKSWEQARDGLAETIHALCQAIAAAPEGEDPDLGRIERGHVCKHGVRWPHPCQPCDDAAWELQKSSSAEGGEGRLREALEVLEDPRLDYEVRIKQAKSILQSAALDTPASPVDQSR